MSRLEGKAALVTGAGSGIGRAIAVALASEGCGVAVVDRRGDAANETAATIKSVGGRALPIEADVTSAEQVQGAVAKCLAEFARLNVLVNNAGVGYLGTVVELDEAAWDQVMAVNLKSVFLCSREAIPRLIEAGGGRIINLASVAGVVASPGRAAYCASKGGVVMLTKAMALDCAPLGINVNAICPGVVITAMTRDSLQDPTIRKEKLDKTPLGWLAQPEDIAPAAVFLASAESKFITGHCLVVDGGWSID